MAAAQVARLAGSLLQGGHARLERLRGLSAGVGRLLTCTCSRIALAGGTTAILIVANEPAGPVLPLAERVRRLLGDAGHPLAAFAADGALLHATAEARAALGGATSLAALGADALAAAALADGHASGATRAGDTAFDRIGSAAATVLVVSFPQQPAAAPAAAPETPAPAPAVAPPAAPTPPEQADERRHPLRFVWQMDADGRFAIGSDEFLDLIGPHTTATFSRRWRESAAELGLDPDGRVERALASRATWSGIVVSWPADGTSERMPVELSGLPVFDRDRQFCGYRGFGVCRDLSRINALAQARRVDPPVVDAPPPPLAGESAAPARPALSLVAGPANVVPFRSAPPPAAAETRTPSLSPVERKAFRDLAQELTARLKGDSPNGPVAAPSVADDIAAEAAAAPLADSRPAKPPTAAAASLAEFAAAAIAETAQIPHATEQSLLDRIPLGVLVYRHDSLVYANRAFLAWTGYDSLDALTAAGGLDSLFVESGAGSRGEIAAGQPLSIATHRGDRVPLEGRLLSVPWWDGESALAIVVTYGDSRQKDAELALREAQTDVRELETVLDTAADAVIVLDGEGKILAANGSGENLFGRDFAALRGRPFADLLVGESQRAARDYFERIARGARPLSASIEVGARGRDDRPLVLAMAVGQVGGSDRFCAAFRDVGAQKKLEEDLRAVKREAQRASETKSDFLAKVSHEIRTPLNAINGFVEVMMAERFGPIANERYRVYLKDIHAAGGHLVALLNDLLDLSKIEAGKLDLTFANIALNDLIQQCVAVMQPQASRARVIIRSSLMAGLPQILGDARAVRQIVLNLLANSIKFTGPGGQVIVSTALTDGGDAVLRVRDTGVGMSEKDIEAALEPFRQVATAGSWGSGGTGLGLPLTKALAEANRATFSIKSAPNAGTLAEVTFPASRVLAE